MLRSRDDDNLFFGRLFCAIAHSCFYSLCLIVTVYNECSLILQVEKTLPYLLTFLFHTDEVLRSIITDEV